MTTPISDEDLEAADLEEPVRDEEVEITLNDLADVRADLLRCAEHEAHENTAILLATTAAEIDRTAEFIRRQATEIERLTNEVRLYDPRWMLTEWQAKHLRGEVSADEMPYAEKILAIQNEKWPAAAKPLLDWVASLQDRWDRSFNKGAALSLTSETREMKP